MIHLLSVDHRAHGLDAVARLGAVTARMGPDLLRAVPGVRGAVVLATCNRLALVLDADAGAGAGGAVSGPGPGPGVERGGAGPADSGSAPGAADSGSPALARAVAAFLDARAPGSAAPDAAGPGASAAPGPGVSADGPVPGAAGAAPSLNTAPGPLVPSAWSGPDAVAELFATAAGLESMVVGEREIAGQLRRAATVARAEGTLTAELDRALSHASAASRRVAGSTRLAGTGRSVVAVGLDLAACRLPPLGSCRVLLVGTGAYAGATVTALHERGARDIGVYSRTDRARAFAAGRGLRAVSDAELPGALALADLVITCRGLGAPVLTRELVATSLRLRRRAESAPPDRPAEPGPRIEGRGGRTGPAGRPLVVLDLALRRDVEESVGRLPGVALIDLAAVQRAVPEAEAAQVRAARDIVAREAEAFDRAGLARRMDPLICALRERVEALVEDELARLRPRYGMVDVEDAARALRHLAARILHHPTVAAHRAGREGREGEYLAALELVLGSDVGGALIADAGVDSGAATDSGANSGSDTAASAGTTAGPGAAADSGAGPGSGADPGSNAGPAADSDVGSDADPARPAHPKERND